MTISLQFSRISTGTEISLPETRISRQRKPFSVRCSSGGEAATSSSVESEFNAKAFRHNLTRSDNYNRKGFGHKEEILEQMSQEFTSPNPTFSL
ncbi:hypothetical protein ACS0TY_001144 [Phlomoides rotata]